MTLIHYKNHELRPHDLEQRKKGEIIAYLIS